MAKSSVFRDFITALRQDWRTSLPAATPIPAARGAADGMTVPRASTFHLGVSEKLGMHVFVYFQHSPKAWETGVFTANVILSKREDAPVVLMQYGPADDGTTGEGCYRLGPFLGGRDKWWLLLRGSSTSGPNDWRASRNGDPAAVIAEAVADVTRDVRSALERLQVG